jgi:capsular exopolysaccharide synthesis family protein
MEIKEYLQTLWKWWWLILLCTLCAAIASFVVSSMLPPVYEAKVLLMSNQSMNTGIMDYSSLLGGQRVIETYQELVKTWPVLDAVIVRLDLPYSTRELSKRIEVNVIPDTQLLELRVKDNDAQRAADIANEMALTFLLQRSAEQQLQEIEGYEQIVAAQMRVLEQAIEEAAVEIEQARTSPGLLTQEELAVLQGNRSQQQSAYASLLAGYLNIRAMKSRLLDVAIVEPAQPPSVPIGPRKLFNTAIATMSGCMIACVLAFLLEYLNDTLESADDMRDTLSLPSLGTIPFVRAWQRNGHAHIKAKEWPIAEAFRILRTNIHFANVDSTIRTLLVTSSGPGEGKTSVVANLGVVMAQNGRKVLLVDADLRRSQLHNAFKTHNYVGLTSLLLNDAKQQECVVETEIPNLYVIPSGPSPPNPSELLGSQRMAQLIEEFQASADIVLFDVPPLLACADAMVLASQMDGAVLVVDSRSTRPEAAAQALEMLRNAEAKVLGGVLNKAHAKSSGYYYYYSDGGESKKRFWRRRFGRDGRKRKTQRKEKLEKERDAPA